MGAEITVLSHSLRKQDDGKRLGADHFFATSDPETFTRLRGSFDLIINTVSVDMDWNPYLGLLKVDGSMVAVGLPETPATIALFSLVLGRRSLAGSAIGGIRETQELLDFCVQLFNAQEGRYRKDLNELVEKKFIPKLPDAPAGMKLEYDATAGKVKVVKQ